MTDGHSGRDIQRVGVRGWGAGLRGPAEQEEIAQILDVSVRSTKVSFPRELGQRVCVCMCVYKGTAGFKFRDVREAVIRAGRS